MTRKKGPSVLVLSAASGAGHVKAAEALVAACTSHGIPARHVEVLKYTNKVFRKLYSDTYIDLVNRQPDLLGWGYNLLDHPWRFQKTKLALDLLNAGPLVRFLAREKPDIVVCTHFLPAEILLHLREKKLLDVPMSIVITDYDAHALWLFQGVDFYFVACEETRVYLEAVGIPAGTIHVTGIPVDPRFGLTTDRRAARRELGLDPKKTTILVSAGGFGVGPMEAIVRRRPLRLAPHPGSRDLR